MLVAEFGSRHNGYASCYSDRDLLIVSSDWSRINFAKNYYSNIGFSVTSFHTSKAKYLAKNGSLFFKHVIDESVLISDSSGIYRELNDSWKPQSNYNREIESNIDLLEMINYMPKSKYTANYVVDMLVISVRNILIRQIAETGRYIFDWETLARVAFEYGYISYSDIALISYSRKVKNRYRMGVYDNVSHHIINGLISILNSVQNESFKLRFLSNKSILSLPERFDNGSYKQLKALEAICCLYSFDPSLMPYMELVKDPNYACATSALTNASRGTVNA
ncbi:hypothetical protein LF048_003362 [Vibrio cholerae]|nr:hypothetical protein [Vibrio cholerae]